MIIGMEQIIISANNVYSFFHTALSLLNPELGSQKIMIASK